jgi:hypothetical protein
MTEPTPEEIRAKFIKAKATLPASRLRARLKVLLDRQREICCAMIEAEIAASDLTNSYMAFGSQIAELCREFTINNVEFDDYRARCGQSDTDGITLTEVFHAEDASSTLEIATLLAMTRVAGLEAILADQDADLDTIKQALIRTYYLDEDIDTRQARADAVFEKFPPERKRRT